MVELMVALLLGALITTGIVQMFSSNQENYQVLTGQARMQENGRFAMSFLTRAVRMAGFTGCYSEEVDLRNVLNQTKGTWEFEMDHNVALTGFEATTQKNWSPDIKAMVGKQRNLDQKQLLGGTDIFAVRFADSDNSVRVRLSQASTTGDIITETPGDPTLFEVGDVVVVSDCSKGAVFQITSAVAAAPNYTIQHSTGGGVVPGNSTTDLSGIGTVFDVDSVVFPVNTNIFFVGDGTGTNNRGQTPISLWQQVNNDNPLELVEGVEDLQVSYGVDTDGDGIPNRYQTIQAVADPSTIITVRVAVTVSSVDVVTTQGDGLLRRTFTKTVAIRNRVRG